MKLYIVILIIGQNLLFSQVIKTKSDSLRFDSISVLNRTLSEKDKKISELDSNFSLFKPIIEETRITKLYFYSIVGGFFTGIGIIVTLIVLLINNLSSRNLMREVDSKIVELNNSFTERNTKQKASFDEFKETVEMDIRGIIYNVDIADFNICRSVYASMMINDFYGLAFQWSIYTVDAARRIGRKDIHNWLSLSNESLDEEIKKKAYHSHLKELLSGLIEKLNDVKNLTDSEVENMEDVRKLSEEIIEKLNRYCWTDVPEVTNQEETFDKSKSKESKQK